MRGFPRGHKQIVGDTASTEGSPDMADHDPVTAHLDTLYARCCAPRRERQILDRWAARPALRSRRIDQLVAVLGARGHRDHNPILAALVAGHRDGDDDATTVLLTAIRPLVVALDGRIDRPDRHADLWAAVAKRLATTTPAEIDALGPHRPFLAILIGRLRRDAARLHADRDRGRPPATVPLTDTTPRTRHTAALVSTPEPALDDIALARCELAAVTRHVRRGDIGAAAWRHLIDHRLHGHTHPGTASRNKASRTGRRLANLVGHNAA